MNVITNHSVMVPLGDKGDEIVGVNAACAHLRFFDVFYVDAPVVGFHVIGAQELACFEPCDPPPCED